MTVLRYALTRVMILRGRLAVEVSVVLAMVKSGNLVVKEILDGVFSGVCDSRRGPGNHHRWLLALTLLFDWLYNRALASLLLCELALL